VGQEFATPTEEAFAKLLDALGISWQYEPREFPLEEKPDGKVKTAFRPDFYLPELDLYVELTMMRTMTAKNRKMRLMSERYPDVRVVLLGKNLLSVLS
jgi:hypoxanthine phosphoribosyltransferase